MTLEEELFGRHRGKSVLLDSNLLLVFLTGAVGAHLFARFKRVNEYTVQDFELLVQLLRSFRVLITTPHILTEVSNLANSLTGTYRRDWFTNFAVLVASEQEGARVMESWTPARQLADSPEFVEFGITDSAVVAFASDALVITDDYRLSGALRNRGFDVLNFKDLQAIQRLIQ